MNPFDEFRQRAHDGVRFSAPRPAASAQRGARARCCGGQRRRGVPRPRPAAGGRRGSRSCRTFGRKAKRVLCLFQSEGFSHVDLFDYKPTLTKHHGQEIPPSVKGNQRLTGMTSGQATYPVVAPLWPGRPCGQHGTWISDQLPHIQPIADDICIVKSMYTEAINHDPAITFINTGNQQPGYASMGAWVSYGLGSENENLPTFIAMVSQGSGKNPGQPIFSRLWGSGFLPSTHQGVGPAAGGQSGACIWTIRRAPTASSGGRCSTIWRELNQMRAAELGDPETLARIHAYEMAFRMQTSVPELTDLSDEPATMLDIVRAARSASRAATRPIACWRGGCWNAACGSCSSFIAAGISTSPSRGNCRTNAATSISRPRR